MAFVSALAWGYLFYGLIDLYVAIDQTPGFYDSYLLETGWGLIYTFLVALPLASLVFSPRLSMPLVQVSLIGVAVGVTALGSGALRQLLPAIALILNALLLARLARGSVRPVGGWSRPRWDLALAALATLLLPLAATYAVDMMLGYRQARPPTDDDTWGLDHWPMQAALAVSVVVVALAVSAGARSHWAGTAVSVASVSLTAAWFGVTCVIYPDHAGSVGRSWGLLTAAWAGAFFVVAAWRLSRYRAGA